ncbi:hypothetical protein GQ44DRAFT_117127 [Phaeosphaeriaceae sp. PMI808]|nr:hypothetical protein GQ44DRAFT_117127 [Phaeosphaeriaceae sp. PMI808]
MHQERHHFRELNRPSPPISRSFNMLKITEAVTVLIHTPLQDLAKEIELKNLFNIVQEAITLSEAANDVRLPGTVNKTPLSNTANDNALSTTANDDALSETANDIALPNSANNAKLLQKANDISLSTIVKELPDHDYRIADIEGYKWESIRKGFRFLMACRELAEEYVASPLKRKRNTKTYATTRFPDSPRHQIQAAIRTGSKLIKLQHDLEATSRPPLLLLFATTPRLLGRNNTNDILEDLKSPELSEAMNLVIKYAQLETEAYDAYKAKAIRFRTQV